MNLSTLLFFIIIFIITFIISFYYSQNKFKKNKQKTYKSEAQNEFDYCGINFKKHVIECMCQSNDHIAIIYYDIDSYSRELYIDIQLKYHTSFLKKLKVIWNYLRSKDEGWNCIMINQNEALKIVKFIKEYNENSIRLIEKATKESINE